jgi:hypothetical protein
MTGGGNKDPCQVVGGIVYAKADSISRDFKRILGNKFKTAWIRGEVLSVDKKKANPEAKRSTMMESSIIRRRSLHCRHSKKKIRILQRLQHQQQRWPQHNQNKHEQLPRHRGQ